MLHFEYTQIIVNGMANQDSIEFNTANFGLYIGKIVCILQMAWRDAAESRPIIDNWLRWFHILVHDDFTFFVDNGYTSQHVTAAIGTNANHLTIQCDDA